MHKKHLVIYKIENKLDGKIYVGSTNCFKARRNIHLSSLRRNKHWNNKLQHAWNKHGGDNFEFTILEEIKDEASLIPREQYYIDTLNPQYNLRKVADRSTGYKHTAKALKQISEAGKKPIVQYDKQLNLIQEWDSIRTAAQELGISETQISDTCNGKIWSAGGFIFQHKFCPNLYTPKPRKGYGGKQYKVTYSDGTEIVIKNFVEYCQTNNLNHNTYSKYINKNTMEHLGFIITPVNEIVK